MHSPCTSEFTVHRQIKIPRLRSATREGDGGRARGRAHSRRVSHDVCWYSSERRLKPSEEKATLHITHYYSLFTAQRKRQTSKQSTSNGYQLISQLSTKIYEAASYERFWTLLVAVQPAIPPRFEPLFFGVWEQTKANNSSFHAT